VRISLPLVLVLAIAAGQTVRQGMADEATKLSKDEILMLMIQVGRIPVVQQDRKMDMIWTHLNRSDTPKSDYLFCSGFAYLGNYKAQACLGNAFENGRGTAKDLLDAYVWYSIAFDNPIDDPEIRQQIRSSRERIKKALLTGVSAKTEKELEDQVKLQKATKMLYLTEFRNTRD
jgi:ribosomal protein S18